MCGVCGVCGVCGAAFSRSECCSRPSRCADTSRAADRDVSVYHGCCAVLLLALRIDGCGCACMHGRGSACAGVRAAWVYAWEGFSVSGDWCVGATLLQWPSLMRCMTPVIVYLCRAARSQPAGFVVALPLGHLVVVGSGISSNVIDRHLSWSPIAK